jgi:hypothetical protein
MDDEAVKAELDLFLLESLSSTGQLRAFAGTVVDFSGLPPERRRGVRL